MVKAWLTFHAHMGNGAVGFYPATGYFYHPTKTKMQTYLGNLLPRLQQFSQTLDKKELLIDQPWILIDSSMDRHQYIFQRDGRLLVSLNGNVEIGVSSPIFSASVS